MPRRRADGRVPGGHLPLAISTTPEIEKLARAVYQRDYVLFGFGDWR